MIDEQCWSTQSYPRCVQIPTKCNSRNWPSSSPSAAQEVGVSSGACPNTCGEVKQSTNLSSRNVRRFAKQIARFILDAQTSRLSEVRRAHVLLKTAVPSFDSLTETYIPKLYFTTTTQLFRKAPKARCCKFGVVLIISAKFD